MSVNIPHIVHVLTIICIFRIIFANPDRLRAKLSKKDKTILVYFSGNLAAILACYKLPVFSYAINKGNFKIYETEITQDYMAKRGAYAGLTMLLSVFHRFALLDIISSEIIKVIQFRNKRKGEYSQQINIAALNGNFADSVSFFCIHPLPKTRLHCIQSNTSP